MSNDISTVIKTLMKDKGVRQADLARLFGISPQAIFKKFANRSWDVEELLKILDYMDCRLIIESGDIKQYRFN